MIKKFSVIVFIIAVMLSFFNVEARHLDDNETHSYGPETCNFCFGTGQCQYCFGAGYF